MNTTLPSRASAALTTLLLAVGLSGCFIVDASRYEGLPDDAGADAAPDDGGNTDAGARDGGATDAGAVDAGLVDAGPVMDAGEPDAGEPDGGPPDAGEPDGGQPDAGEPDGGPPDAGSPDGGANCASGHGGCDVLVSCTDGTAGPVCGACPSGYSGTGASGCVDLDECATGTPCGTTLGTACSNNPGSYVCGCPPGYSGTGTTGPCVDIDECTTGASDCDTSPTTSCANADGAFACACPASYVGTGHGASGCLYADPTLSDLSFGPGAIATAPFAPGTLTYAVTLPAGAASTLVTPTVAQPTRATITVGGSVTASGASATVAVGYGPTPVSIVVTTESGATRTYTVLLTRGGSVYFKASRTNSYEGFGTSLSLSADGTRLAVGKPGESSNATGVGGVENNYAAAASGAVYVFLRTGSTWTQEAYLKASNTGAGDFFGFAVSLSADGTRLAVGAPNEDSSATGVGGDQASNATSNSGAAYVFQRTVTGWAQEAYVKASNPDVDDNFGNALALSADGTHLAIGAPNEDSNAVGAPTDNSALGSGAAYVFVRAPGWTQEAYVKASNPDAGDAFGSVVSLSADGATLAVGAHLEDSSATDVGGVPSDNSAADSGAAYVFARVASTWSQEAYVKASNTDVGDDFGFALALASNGQRLVVGARNEDSSATTVGGSDLNGGDSNGAAYVFVRSGAFWTQEEYLKPSNSDNRDRFGWSVAISGDGTRVAVGTPFEASDSLGLNGSQVSNSMPAAGAAYVFHLVAATWAQEAYVKSSNTEGSDTFGVVLAFSGDGARLAVSASGEASNATGLNGNQANNAMTQAGAVYVY